MKAASTRQTPGGPRHAHPIAYTQPPQDGVQNDTRNFCLLYTTGLRHGDSGCCLRSLPTRLPLPRQGWRCTYSLAHVHHHIPLRCQRGSRVRSRWKPGPHSLPGLPRFAIYHQRSPSIIYDPISRYFPPFSPPALYIFVLSMIPDPGGGSREGAGRPRRRLVIIFVSWALWTGRWG